MRDSLPQWLATASPAAAGIADPALVATADAHRAGLVEIRPDGSVRWTDEAYRLHGRPRWRRVRSLEDVVHGLDPADAERLTSAYLGLLASPDVEARYTARSESGRRLDVVLRGAWRGVAVVERAGLVLGEPSIAVQPAQHVPIGSEPDGGPTDDAPAAEIAEHDDVPPEPPSLPTGLPVTAPDLVVAALPVVGDDDTPAFRTLFDATPSALAELREDGSFVRVNDAFCRLVGRTWDSLRDTVYEALTHHEDRASALVSRARRAADEAASAPSEHRLVHSDGSLVWVRARTSLIAGPDGPRLLLSLENVTATRAREEQLRHDALHDPLTGLPNRRLVLDRLERAVSRARRTGSRLAVFFVDVDDLKHVNDTHPWQHRAGDVLLSTLAVALRATLRDTDTVGRLAGDEFLVICEDVADDDAVDELGQRLIEAARQPVPLGPSSINPTVSVGLAVATVEDEEAGELLARADAAMYVAKSRGGGRVVRAEAIAAAPPVDLVGALGRGELRMQYQPVVSLATGAVLGVSAVLRWVHPSAGMLPAHDVRTALDSPASQPVVDWCLDRAVNDVRTVAPGRVEHVSVWLPVPGRALLAAGTVEALRAAVAGADGSQNADTAPSLVLDVHEADVVSLTRRATSVARLQQLSALGPIALGVEHLSADVLPVGALQLLAAASASLDPELVLAAAENGAGEALVRSLVSGATALGVVTVATGISSHELLEEARRLGVHAVSGDLVGPAASLEVYSDLLHGERVVLPGMLEATVVVPVDDDGPHDAAGPVLAAIRALEDDDVRGPAVPEPVEAAPAEPAASARAAEDAPHDDEVTTGPEHRAATEDSDGSEDAGSTDGSEDSEAAPSSPDEEPEPSSAAATADRLLLDDVVDLAEQVARELGVMLPSSPSYGSTPSYGSAPADEAPRAGATQRRLPGLEDLHAALGSPEVARALDDSTPGQRPEAPGPDESTAGDADPHSGDDVTDVRDSALAAPPGTRDAAGRDLPTILLGPTGVDLRAHRSTGPTLHLHGRGGSDGGSIL